MPSRRLYAERAQPWNLDLRSPSPQFAKFRTLDEAAQQDVIVRARLLFFTGVEPTPELLDQIITEAAECSERTRAQAAAVLEEFLARRRPQEQVAPGEVVYYVRFAERVKIGTTKNFSRRRSGIPHDELLATEPGGRDLERTRHVQFAPLRVRGEWFRLAEPLVSHIACLNQSKTSSSTSSSSG